MRDGPYTAPDHWFAGFIFVDALLQRVPSDEREPLLARLVDWASAYSKRIEQRGDWAAFGRRQRKSGGGYETIVARALAWGAKEATNAKLKRAAERLNVGLDLLLEHGADPNAKMKFATGETETALHRAVKLGQKALALRLLLVAAARALVEAGADPRVRGEDQLSAIDHAAAEGPKALQKLFASVAITNAIAKKEKKRATKTPAAKTKKKTRAGSSKRAR